jgi:hypothetical protein
MLYEDIALEYPVVQSIDRLNRQDLTVCPYILDSSVLAEDVMIGAEGQPDLATTMMAKRKGQLEGRKSIDPVGGCVNDCFFKSCDL